MGPSSSTPELEQAHRRNCGILEGGYSVPAASGFRCADAGATLAECRQVANQRSCAPGR